MGKGERKKGIDQYCIKKVRKRNRRIKNTKKGIGKPAEAEKQKQK